MKDEEMAEKYKVTVHRWRDSKGELVQEEDVKQAFLDGLKAGSQLDEVWHDYDAGEDCYEDSHEGRWVKRETGRPQWHEIESKVSPKREISKRYMPKNKEKVLLKYHFSGEEEIHISDGYYDAYDFEFHIANNPKHRIVCVIAWKEIVPPKEIE